MTSSDQPLSNSPKCEVVLGDDSGERDITDGFLVIHPFNPLAVVGFYPTREEAESVAAAPDENGLPRRCFVLGAREFKRADGGSHYG